MQILEVRAMPWAAGLFAAGVLQQGINLDDVGAPIGELAHAGRPRADPGEVKYREARQGLRGAREGHSGAPEEKRRYLLIDQILRKYNSLLGLARRTGRGDALPFASNF